MEEQNGGAPTFLVPFINESQFHYSMAIKVLIFDLDDTLLDSTEQMRWRAVESSCVALRENGFEMKQLECEEFLTKESLKLMSMKKALKKLCKNDEKLMNIGYDGYHDFGVSGITLHDGVSDLLSKFKRKYTLVLLSSGDPELQKRKLAELRIADLFDHILYDDRKNKKTKKEGLQKIMKKFGFEAEQHVVIGDRIDNELRYGKELGMKTILVQSGPYATLKPKNENEKPDQTVQRVTNVDDAIKAL